MGFGSSRSRCVVNPGKELLFCVVELSGTMPPYEGVLPQHGRDPDAIVYSTADQRFVAGIDESGDTAAAVDTLHPGENVTIGEVAMFRKKDGTTRVETGDHWFEVSPSGQYSSDTFDPAGAKPPEAAPQQAESDAVKYADLVAPGDTFCGTIPTQDGKYVVSINSPSGCALGIKFLTMFVNEPDFNDHQYFNDHIPWNCRYAGSGAAVCDGLDLSAVGRFTRE